MPPAVISSSRLRTTRRVWSLILVGSTSATNVGGKDHQGQAVAVVQATQRLAHSILGLFDLGAVHRAGDVQDGRKAQRRPASLRGGRLFARHLSRGAQRHQEVPLDVLPRRRHHLVEFHLHLQIRGTLLRAAAEPQTRVVLHSGYTFWPQRAHLAACRNIHNASDAAISVPPINRPA